MADFLLDQGKGDLSLVSAGGCTGGIYNSYGVNGRLFDGKIKASNYNTILPGLGTSLVNVTMTGREIFELLEQGRVLADEKSEQTASFDYYWSGLEVTLHDGKAAKAVFPDGSRMDADTEYQVSMSSKDFDEERFKKVTKTGKLVADAYLEYLKNHKAIQAPKAGRRLP